jgi:hypothetical protein
MLVAFRIYAYVYCHTAKGTYMHFGRLLKYYDLLRLNRLQFITRSSLLAMLCHGMTRVHLSQTHSRDPFSPSPSSSVEIPHKLRPLRRPHNHPSTFFFVIRYLFPLAPSPLPHHVPLTRISSLESKPFDPHHPSRLPRRKVSAPSS